MNTTPFILDLPLPPGQDFTFLKKEGLAFIQQHSGTQWTNLNTSDPGVTILDQVCYALTELGYCTGFPMVDILTGPDGKINVKDQFYLPAQILTSAPVTADDYRKCVIAEVNGVDNVLVLRDSDAAPALPVQSPRELLTTLMHTVSVALPRTTAGTKVPSLAESGETPGSGVSAPSGVAPNVTGGVAPNMTAGAPWRYKTYLLINPARLQTEWADICLAAYYCLNSHRSLGEVFGLPIVLKPFLFVASGRIEISAINDLNGILLQARDILRSYIFPIVRIGSADMDDPYQGPVLPGGGIPTESLGNKRSVLRTMEVSRLISGIQGVQSVSLTSFAQVPTGVAAAAEITVGEDQMLVLDWVSSLNKGLEVYCKGVRVPIKPSLISDLSSFADELEPLPYDEEEEGAVITGTYREINHYYSIQNTFPEIFAVGADAKESNVSDFQMAQSRQLKGYLTLIDQVLANQFSQLANVDKLFSFRNTLTGTPSDRAKYLKMQESSERPGQEFPVPYLRFSPTYFYQSLYEVPHIAPLLKDHDGLSVYKGVTSPKALKHQNWVAYQMDPYNPYIRGLMDMVEDDDESLQRRNALLDHLLARHGESPLWINTILEDTVYSGDPRKDKVIGKSLYLQNLGKLTYARQKGYRFLSAYALPEALEAVPQDFELTLLGDESIDFISNASRMDKVENLGDLDFVQYSALELAAGLLLGLKLLYKEFIAYQFDTGGKQRDIQQAWWMIQYKRGLILIEKGVLLSYVRFSFILTKDPEKGPYYAIDQSLNYEEALALAQYAVTKKTSDPIDETQGTFNAYRYSELQTAESGQYYQPIPGTPYSFTVKTADGYEVPRFDEFPCLDNDVELIFPAFIPALLSPGFAYRMEILLQEWMPVHLSWSYRFFGGDQLAVFIPFFAHIHNSLIYHPPTASDE